jgi:FkbM family methyltransferase
MSTHCITREGTLSSHIQLSILKAADRILRGRDYAGQHKVCRLVGAFFPRQNSVVIEQDGMRLKIYLADPYWVRYVFLGFSYEEEIAGVLNVALDGRSVFIDCGANTGYWSIYAAQKIGSKDRVLAVEPAEQTFARLCENNDLNDRSFRPVRRVVYSRSGTTMQFRTASVRHEANSCLLPNSDDLQGCRIESVESVTVDDLFDGMGLSENEVSSVVVKLDVEGTECEALQGAERLIQRGAVFIYEDHGRDLRCRSTDFALNKCCLDVFLLQSPTKWVQIKDPMQLARLKVYPWKGYNLLAAKRNSPRLAEIISSKAAGSVCGTTSALPRGTTGSSQLSVSVQGDSSCCSALLA